MFKRFIKNDKQLENARKIMYFVIILFIGYFFIDIHIQSSYIVDKEYNLNNNDIITLDIDYFNDPVPEYNYYGIYIRKIAFDIVQIIFLMALYITLWVVEVIKSGKYK